MRMRHGMPGWGIILLLCLIGCGKTPEPPVHTAAWLNRMSELRTSQPGHALLISPSGMMACLPYRDQVDAAPDTLPVDGLYFGPMRLLAGWRWQLEKAPTKPMVSAPDAVRPDFIQTSQADGIGTRITLDTENPVALLELIAPPLDQVIELSLSFDIRPTGLSYLDSYASYDKRENVLFVGSDLYGFVAVRADAEWLPAPSRHRIDYAEAYSPLDKAATVFEPGVFRFRDTDNVTVFLGAGLTKEAALSALQQCGKDAAAIRMRTETHALNILNRAPFFSKDTTLAVAVSWDRWLTTSHFLDSGPLHGLLPLPPLGLEPDGATLIRAIPAWWYASGGNTEIESRFDSLLAIPDSMLNLEESLFELVGWMDWIDLSGHTGVIGQHRESLAVLFDAIGKAATAEDGEGFKKYPSHWTRKLDLLNLPPRGSEDRFALYQMLKEVTRRGQRWSSHDSEWVALLKKTAGYHTDIGFRGQAQISATLKRDRFLWTEKHIEAWQEALANPAYNLGYVETSMLIDRDDVNSRYLVNLIPDDWKCDLGLRWNSDLLFKNVCFNAPYWTAGYTRIRENNRIHQNDWESLKTLAYAEYYDSRTPTLRQPLPGGSPEALATIGERVRYFYEAVLGLHPSPIHSRILISPPDPLEFWQDREYTCILAVGTNKLLIESDPFRGRYCVSHIEGKDKLSIDLKDVIVDEIRCSISINILPGRTALLERKAGESGELTLFLNGTELKGVERSSL